LFKSGKGVDNFMATQMTSARRGVATDEMKQVAKDEDVSLDWLIP
jgi:phosphomethylpyrimidine synthase